MIRLVILVIICVALYPYIGDGLHDFTNDFNTDAVRDFVEKQTQAFKDLFSGITEKKPWYKRIFS